MVRVVVVVVAVVVVVVDVVVCCYESFSYLHFAAATSFCLVVRTSILKNRFNKLFQLVKKTFSAKESSPPKNSLDKKYLDTRKFPEIDSPNEKNSQSDVFLQVPRTLFYKTDKFY